MRNRHSESGNQTLEFTLVGLPLTFILFSIANMSFCMLTMHTMQEAVEQGARYVSTHGSDCSTGSNSCAVTVQQIATIVASAASGVSASKMSMTLTPASGNTISCSPLKTCLSGCGSTCNANVSSKWPSSTNNDNNAGQDIVVSATCTVSAPIMIFWPAWGPTKNVTSASFGATSRQRLLF